MNWQNLTLLACAAAFLAGATAAQGAPSTAGSVHYTKSDEIWVMDADGENQRAAFNPSGTAWELSAAADGTLAWTDNNFQAWIKPPAERARRLNLSSSLAAINMDISADGTKVVVTAAPFLIGGDLSIYVGSTAKDGTFSYVGEGEEPAFSPDGTKIVYISYGAIFVYDMATGQRTLVQTGGSVKEPEWSPDARRIVYVRDARELWTMHATGGGHELVATGETEIADPVWAPDNSAIAFRDRVLHLGTEAGDIASVSPSGGAVKYLTQNSTHEGSPAFAPVAAEPLPLPSGDDLPRPPRPPALPALPDGGGTEPELPAG